MVRFYASRVEMKRMSINQVPKKLREEVRELVISEGYEFDDEGYVTDPKYYNMNSVDKTI